MFSALGSALELDWNVFPEVKDAYKPSKTEVYQDMTHPLPHYFISSGHNSYLTGNQLNSSCGTKTIIKCLREGCRVVELDVYYTSGHGPCGALSGLVCKHGGTATKPVSAKLCVEAVHHHAFHASPYPVIITVENHLAIEQERELGHMLRSVLGDSLYVPPVGHADRMWLSPEALKHKVLIRTTRMGGVVQTSLLVVQADSLKARGHAPELEEVVYIWAEKLKALDEMIKIERSTSSSIGEAYIPKIVEFTQYLASHPSIRKGPRKEYDELSPAAKANEGEDTTAYARDRDDADPEPTYDDEDIDEERRGTSRARRKAAKQHSAGGDGIAGKPGSAPAAPPGEPDPGIASDDGTVGSSSSRTTHVALRDVYHYTSRHLLRTYPAGWRVNSSNYDPVRPWAIGASFVALNWQEWDKPCWLNSGKFADNGGCGYVLKPEWMLQPGAGDEAALNWKLPERAPRRLAVHIYAAFHTQKIWQKCYLADDLYVKINIEGLPHDTQRHVTKAVQDSAKLLVDKTFEVRVHYPEVALLLLQLKDQDLHDDNSLCYACVPLSTLQEGSFKIPMLKSSNGKQKPGRWVKLRFEWLDPPNVTSSSQANLPSRDPQDAAPAEAQLDGAAVGGGAAATTAGAATAAGAVGAGAVAAPLPPSVTPGALRTDTAPGTAQLATPYGTVTPPAGSVAAPSAASPAPAHPLTSTAPASATGQLAASPAVAAAHVTAPHTPELVVASAVAGGSTAVPGMPVVLTQPAVGGL